MTYSTVPEQPSKLKGEVLSASSVRLTWDSPETTGENIESFELYYNDSDFRQNVHITVVPPVNSYTLEDLTPNTVYQVKVAAKSSRGEGASTAPITVRTHEAGEPAASQIIV